MTKPEANTDLWMQEPVFFGLVPFCGVLEGRPKADRASEKMVASTKPFSEETLWRRAVLGQNQEKRVLARRPLTKQSTVRANCRRMYFKHGWKESTVQV